MTSAPRGGLPQLTLSATMWLSVAFNHAAAGQAEPTPRHVRSESQAIAAALHQGLE